MRKTLRQSEVSQLRDEIWRPARHENVLILEVAMNVALRVRVRQRLERLRNDRDAVVVRQTTPACFGKFASIGAVDVFTYEIDHAVVRAAIDKLDDVFVF